MIRGLFGSTTQAGLLRASLDDQSARHRAISDGIANAVTPGGGFAETLNQQLPGEDPAEADLHDQMVALADTSLRYDAAARLLQRTYQQLRTAIHERT